MAEEAAAPTLLGRLWNGLQAAVTGVPRIIVFTLGIFVLSSLLKHYTGFDPIQSDNAHAAGEIGSKLLTSLLLGTAITFGIGVIKGTPDVPAPTGQQTPAGTPNHVRAPSMSPDVAPPLGLPPPPVGTQRAASGP